MQGVGDDALSNTDVVEVVEVFLGIVEVEVVVMG